jgi:hypothetical protein
MQDNSVTIQDIDWDLLHQQKQSLLTVIDISSKIETDFFNNVSGLVSLIDTMQDRAAEKGLWKFPEETE